MRSFHFQPFSLVTQEAPAMKLSKTAVRPDRASPS
jgi:hypothetical protein